MLPNMNSHSNAYSNAFPTNQRHHSSVSIASTTSSFSTGHAQTHGIAEYRHATPPRHNDRALPSTPSSARLRRVAPSPLRIAGSSRLRFSPESPTSTSQERGPEGGIRGRQLQYNLSAFAQAVAEANRAKMGPPLSRGQTQGQGQGSEQGQPDLEPSMSTSRLVDRGNQGQEDDDGELKEDWTKLTKGEWIRANIPRDIMVSFREDVFGPGPQSPTEEDGAGPAAHTYSPDSVSRVFPSTDRVSMHGSFATFGRRRSQSRGSGPHALARVPGQEQGHARRETAASTDAFSISMYDREDNRHHHDHDQPRSPIDTEDIDWNNPEGVEVPLIFPGYAEDSPASIHTELVTPEHDHPLTLPRHDSEDESEEDTPTKPKAVVKHKSSNNALLLSLHDDAENQGLASESQPRPELELEPEEESWRKANAGVTPAARTRRQAQDQDSGGSSTVYPPLPPVPSLPSVRISPPKSNSSSISATATATASASFSTTASTSTATTIKPTKPTSTDPSDELTNFNQETYIEISVDNGPGQSAYKTTLPFRRISKPEVWQEKEEAALQKAWKWNERPAKPQPFQQTGCVIFGQPPRQRDKWVFGLVDHGTDHDDEDCPYANAAVNPDTDITPTATGAGDGGGGGCPPLPIPSLRTVHVGGDSTRDYMTNHVDLDIQEYGVYQVSGNDKFGRVQWQFEYLVIHQTNYQGDILPNQRTVCPMHFYAATSFFDSHPPAHSPTSLTRSKSKRPSLVSERMDPPRLGTPPKPSVPQSKPAVPTVLPAPIKVSPRSPPRTRQRDRERDGDKDRHERCESSPPQQLRPEVHRHLDVRAIRSALSTPIESSSGTGPSTGAGTSTNTLSGPHLVPVPAGVCISTTIYTGTSKGSRNSRSSRKSPPTGSGPLTGSSGSGSGSGSGGIEVAEKTGGGGGGRMSGFLHKFGAKSKSGRSTPKSQATSPALPHDPTVHPPDKSGYNRAESVKSSKTTRARATSLLSRMTRPFTPPTNSVFDLSLSNSMSKDLPPNPPIPPAHSQAQAQTQGQASGPNSKLTPMRSLASLRPNTPPRFNNSPPVPAIPAGLILVRPPSGRPGSRSNNPSSLSNLVDQHPLTTALREVDPPANTNNSNSNNQSQSQSSDSITNLSGAVSGGGVSGTTTATPKHYITVSTKDKIRPVSSNYDPQAVYLGLGFGAGDHTGTRTATGNGAGGQENVYPPYGQEARPGGLHPPKRPNLRKRPSTADPIVNTSGRLLSTRDSPQCL